jgi:SOS-response transcriptional repressor LexA
MSTRFGASMEEILQRLKYAKRFDTWREVSSYLGIKEGTLSAWRARNSESSIEKILYRSRDDVREEYLLTGEGPMLEEKGQGGGKLQYPPKSAAKVLHDANKPTYQKVDEKGNIVSIFGHEGNLVNEVPIISWNQAGAFADIDYGQVIQWAFYPGKKTPHMFALVVRGDSMEPEFCDGDVIVVDPNRQAMTGDFVIAKTGENEAGVSTLKQYYDDIGTVLLKPLNYKYPIRDMTGVKFQIVGVVVWKMKGY